MGTYIMPFGKKSTAIYEKNGEGKLVILVPKTKKRKELGDLTLLDWLNTKMTQSTRGWLQRKLNQNDIGLLCLVTRSCHFQELNWMGISTSNCNPGQGWDSDTNLLVN